MGDDTVEGTVQVDTTIIYRSVFCQHFLTDLWNDRLRLAFLSEMGHSVDFFSRVGCLRTIRRLPLIGGLVPTDQTELGNSFKNGLDLSIRTRPRGECLMRSLLWASTGSHPHGRSIFSMGGRRYDFESWPVQSRMQRSRTLSLFFDVSPHKISYPHG